jgi:uncharacterized membrane protein
MDLRSLLLAAALAVCLPANAASFIAQTRDGAHIELLDTKGVCLKQALSAIWVSPDATESIAGCWKLVGIRVFITFLDADSLDLLAGAFEQVEGI